MAVCFWGLPSAFNYEGLGEGALKEAAENSAKGGKPLGGLVIYPVTVNNGVMFNGILLWLFFNPAFYKSDG